MFHRFIKQLVNEIGELESMGYDIKDVFVCKMLYDILKEDGFDFKITDADFPPGDRYPSEDIHVIMDDHIEGLYQINPT